MLHSWPSQSRTRAGQSLMSLLWLWMLSPLMFGHNVSSVHHCHTRPAQLLRGYVCVKLSYHRAVVWCHAAPWPVVRDPGVGQALPHYRAVACGRKRQQLTGSRQTRGDCMQLGQWGFTQWGNTSGYSLHPIIHSFIINKKGNQVPCAATCGGGTVAMVIEQSGWVRLKSQNWGPET